jgi:TATA-box binding protein (TBP) (component of TFIID and TFIIIB)
LLWSLKVEEIEIGYLKSFGIQNLAATWRRNKTIDLDKLKERMGEAITYEKEDFPSAMLRMRKKDKTNIERRAQLIKDMRKEIIEDDSWRSTEEKECIEWIRHNTFSPLLMKIRQQQESKYRCKKPDESAIIEMDFMYGSRYIQKMVKMENKPNPQIALLSNSGVVVTTGVHDMDYMVAMYFIILNILWDFEREEKNSESALTVINNQTAVIGVSTDDPSGYVAQSKALVEYVSMGKRNKRHRAQLPTIPLKRVPNHFPDYSQLVSIKLEPQ